MDDLMLNYLDPNAGKFLTKEQAVFNNLILDLADEMRYPDTGKQAYRLVNKELAYLTGDAEFAARATDALKGFLTKVREEGLDAPEHFDLLCDELGLSLDAAQDVFHRGVLTLQEDEYADEVDALIAALREVDNCDQRIDTAVTPLIVLIAVQLAEKVLIDENGGLNRSALSEVRSAGYQHKVLERDSFGPLICGLRTRRGWLAYG